MKKTLNVGFIIILCFSLCIIISRKYFFDYVRVDGNSMLKIFKSNDIIIINKLDKNYKRFDSCEDGFI